jgi:hypothetical protein
MAVSGQYTSRTQRKISNGKLSTADIQSGPIIADETYRGSSTSTPRNDMLHHEHIFYDEDHDPVHWEFWLEQEALSEDPSIFPRSSVAQ